MSLHPPTVVIENVSPLVDGGRYPIKRAIGEGLIVEADVFKDGHDVVAALLKWRKKGETRWHETPMQAIPNGNDRWRATCALFANTTYEYTVEAWGETFRTWQHEFSTKFKAGQEDLQSETLEGANFVAKAAALAAERGQQHDSERLLAFAKSMRAGEPAEVNEIAHYGELEGLMTAYADRSEACEFVLNPPNLQQLVGGAPAEEGGGEAAAAPAKKTRAQEARGADRARGGGFAAGRATRRSMWIASARSFRSGTSSSRAAPRAAATRARPFAIACRASTTRRRWAST